MTSDYTEWIEAASRRVQPSVGTSLCIHGVGLMPGLWCGSCLAEAWQREYAPGSTALCVDQGCSATGPCAAHLPDGTEIPFRSDGSHGLPPAGVFVIRRMPDLGCVLCGHALHAGSECDAVTGYDHLNGDHECGCPGEEVAADADA